MTSNEILDHNVLKNTVIGPTSRLVPCRDQNLTSICVCLSPIADRLETITWLNGKKYRHIKNTTWLHGK